MIGTDIQGRTKSRLAVSRVSESHTPYSNILLFSMLTFLTEKEVLAGYLC